MNIGTLNFLKDYLSTVISGSSDPEECALAENFLWDERPPTAGLDLYRGYVNTGPVADLDDWTNRHGDYVTEELKIPPDDDASPWTFRAGNDTNRLRNIDHRIYLIRVEEASWPCSLIGITTTELGLWIEKWRNRDPAAQDLLERFTSTWNSKRDKRPLFATTELEVGEILNSGESDWPEQLRNRLGLGHYSPQPGGPPVEILIMRYTVAEVLAADGFGLAYPAIPTVLDSPLSCYFYPSPIPVSTSVTNSYYGHTVNLATVDSDNDYQFGIELLHTRLDYRPEHLLQVGVISQPVTMPLERARRFHLPWLQVESGRDDFGTNPPGGGRP